MLSQGLMVVGGGFQAKDHLRQALPYLQGLGLEEKLLESFLAVVKESFLPEGMAGGGPEEGMMLIFGDIQAHDEISLGTSDFLLELTKLLQPGTIQTVHEEPPLKRVGKWVLTPYLLAGGFSFGKTNTLSLIYNVRAERALLLQVRLLSNFCTNVPFVHRTSPLFTRYALIYPYVVSILLPCIVRNMARAPGSYHAIRYKEVELHARQFHHLF
jgi:hypothetical protein